MQLGPAKFDLAQSESEKSQSPMKENVWTASGRHHIYVLTFIKIAIDESIYVISV